MRRFCKYCKKQNKSNRDYCDFKCRLLKDILICENGCWEWQGLLNKGYGYFTQRIINTNKRKMYFAHRVSYEIFNGKFDESLDICHKCDNPKCVKPNHLWIGTHKDNMNDMTSKGRRVYNKNYGEKNGSSKLKEIEVKQIKKLISEKNSFASIARKFNVSSNCIEQINKNITWKNIH